MTIASYSGLQAAISDRLARSDLSASSPTVAEFIAFAEARINRRLLALDAMTRNTTLLVGSEFVPVPSDFRQAQQFYLTTDPIVQLRFMPSELMNVDYTTGTGTPQFYCIEGLQFRFRPAPDSSYTATLLYYAKVPALSSTQTTNWVLAQHPDLYLWSACLEGAIKLKDADGAQNYRMLMEQVLSEIQGATRQQRWGGPGLVVMPG